jgi:hypothetical protein
MPEQCNNWDLVAVLASVVSILGAAFAIAFSLLGWLKRWRRSERLLSYLKLVAEKTPQTPARSVVHLRARLGMTDDEVYRAVFDKKNEIYRAIRDGGPDDGLARDILFRYDPGAAKNQDKNT